MCTKEWLQTGSGTPPYKLGEATLTSEATSAQEARGDLLAEAEFFLKNNPNGVVFEVPDEGMEPFYSIHDYVGGVRVSAKGSINSRRPHLVTFATGEKKIRTIYAERGAYLLMQTNPIYRHDQVRVRQDTILSLHEIVWHRRKGT